MKGKSVTQAGWGVTSICFGQTDCSQATLPIELQELVMNTLSAAACKTAAAQVGDTDAQKLICYGGVAGQSSCVGDSGSPIIHNDGSK